MRALHDAGLTLASDLSLEAVLQRVVDLARELVGARYGALAVTDERGACLRFLTSGLDPDVRARLADPPKGRGLLGIVLTGGRPLRVDAIEQDPRSVGFPINHPRLTTFLGVPIAARGRTRGNLYLADRVADGRVLPFEDTDEDLLQLFAAQAAVAIENARLHAEVQGLAAAAERERIARELHDSLAQALGYLRLRAAAARSALKGGDVARAQLVLGDIATTAGEAYADVREAILGLRSGTAGGRDLASALAEYLERYRLQTGLPVELVLGEGAAEARLAPGSEVQLLRIIQEALTNVRKHAGASVATVRLDLVPDSSGPRLQALVADDGRGFDLRRLPGGSHFGLATMRERAEMAGGAFRVESARGKGTRIAVEFPLESRTSEEG